jgi:hypothetical protein
MKFDNVAPQHDRGAFLLMLGIASIAAIPEIILIYGSGPSDANSASALAFESASSPVTELLA